ncbi:MAG TPA: restriction endonuclease [Gammaproteobacteria bacterium]|nr:restriction endonuclease [Gammaproteobacteria bacterium]
MSEQTQKPRQRRPSGQAAEDPLPSVEVPVWQRLLLAVLLGGLVGLLLSGEFSTTARWAIGAAGVASFLLMLEISLRAQARVHARRRAVAQEWEAIQDRIDALMPELKADFWRGHQYGRQGLESNRRWHNALTDRAQEIWSAIPYDKRAFSRDTIRLEVHRRTKAAMADDTFWTFYSPQMERAEFVHYCQLVLEDNGWTVIPAPPGCFRSVDLVGDSEGVVVLFRCEPASKELGEDILKELAQDARATEVPHAVWVLDGAFPDKVRTNAGAYGISLAQHDDLTVLALRADTLPTIR